MTLPMLIAIAAGVTLGELLFRVGMLWVAARLCRLSEIRFRRIAGVAVLVWGFQAACMLQAASQSLGGWVSQEVWRALLGSQLDRLSVGAAALV